MSCGSNTIGHGAVVHKGGGVCRDLNSINCRAGGHGSEVFKFGESSAGLKDIAGDVGEGIPVSKAGKHRRRGSSKALPKKEWRTSPAWIRLSFLTGALGPLKLSRLVPIRAPDAHEREELKVESDEGTERRVSHRTKRAAKDPNGMFRAAAYIAEEAGHGTGSKGRAAQEDVRVVN